MKKTRCNKEVEQIITQMDFGKNVLILNTNIQEGEPLDYDRCQKSYEFAEKFYLNREDKYSKVVFACDSRLVNPKLKTLLLSNSNIVKIQGNYNIISEDINNRQIEERAYGKTEDEPENYIANTDLQKKLKPALIQG